MNPRYILMKQRVNHPFAPIFDETSTILILGTLPSVKSRANQFYYSHPQNRFWRVLAAIFEDECPETNTDKHIFLQKHHIALWDVLASCEITSSADSSIRNPVVNDLTTLLQKAQIKRIFCNGKKAQELYDKNMKAQYHREAICLPSTSPANATYSLAQLIESWHIIKKEMTP